MKQFIIKMVLPSVRWDDENKWDEISVHDEAKQLMAWIFAYHVGSWHLTKHIPVASTSCCNTMHMILAYTRSIPQLKFQHYDMFRLRWFTLTMVYGTPHEVLINLLYKPKAAPLHHAHSGPLLPSYHFHEIYQRFCFLSPMTFLLRKHSRKKSEDWKYTLST